jgi:hypothetical protein
MKKLIFIVILLPFTDQTHPGIRIVKDRKGNIYYTDLKQVWKITKSNSTVDVIDVHSHELYISPHDNLLAKVDIRMIRLHTTSFFQKENPTMHCFIQYQTALKAY